MFSNNRRNTNEIKFENNTHKLKSELLYLKKCRKQNNTDIFYNTDFIESLREKPANKKFEMISSKSVVQVTESYLEKEFSKKTTTNVRLMNRTQNYDIESSFCLNFKKSGINPKKINIHTEKEVSNDHYIDFSSDSDSEENEEEKFINDFKDDDDNILITSKSKRPILHSSIPKESVVTKNIEKRVIDKKTIKKYLNRESEISNYEYIYEQKTDELIIPTFCYTTWHTKNIPPLMKQNYDNLCENNPEITFELFDENECKKFIENNFPDNVLYAYNCLSPSSYKSDLWRYCVLFIKGGIYLDIKYNTINNFKLKELCYREHFTFDHCGKTLDSIWEEGSFGLYTSIIAVKPNNCVLQKCIDEIVINVESFYYGKNALYPTGPGLLGKIYFDLYYDDKLEFINKIKLFHNEDSNAIIYNNTPILDIYKSYREEQKEYQNNLHYSELWKQRCIYNMDYNILQKKINHVNETHLPNVLCIVHIGSYHIFIKMKKYINNLIKAKYDQYNLTFYFNIINTVRSEHISEIKKLYPDENFVISENYGFDIGSFFHILQLIKLYNETYDYIIKIHTKTNHTLRDELLNPILGDINTIRKIVEMFQDNTKIGMVCSKKSRCIDAQVDFNRNKKYLQQFLYWYFNEKTQAIKQVYSTGTIFWCRFEMFKTMFFKYNISNIYNSFNNIYTFDFNWYYFANKKFIDNLPQEKEKLYKHFIENKDKLKLSGNLFASLKNKTNSEQLRDGMIEHAYERFFGYINHRMGYKYKFID